MFIANTFLGEAYIFIRTGDFATGWTIFVYGDVRKTDPAKCDQTDLYGPYSRKPKKLD